VEKLYLAGKRVVVYFADAARASVLDEYLWTFSQAAFVPHVLWSGAGEAEEPVVLVCGAPANPNRADTLVVGDRLADLAWAEHFEAVHEVLAQTADDAGKPEEWRAAGFEVEESGSTAPRSR
jgi:DNA polymerase III subunit chi